MKDFKILEIKQSVFADNDKDADMTRQGLRGLGTENPICARTGEGIEEWTQ